MSDDRYYVNNSKFLKQLRYFYETNIFTEELGKSITAIANKLINSGKFIEYTYKDEMVSDAILKMVKAINDKKFDVNKTNPFSYFTTITFNAFIARIKKEKKLQTTKEEYREYLNRKSMESNYYNGKVNTKNLDNYE